MEPIILCNFTQNSDLTNWQVVNDGVMGGSSSSTISINNKGHGVFEGSISLENNGGFTLVRYAMQPLDARTYNMVKIVLKGDGKRYQFRIKDVSTNYWSYVAYFNTSGNWETIEIPLETLYPNFRGRRLKAPNFNGKEIAVLGFLAGNKKAASFRLEIDTIALE